MSDYIVRFAPVAGTGPGQAYTINDSADSTAAIKTAKIRHSLDFGFMNVRQDVVAVKVWDGSSWVDITEAALTFEAHAPSDKEEGS